MWDALLYLVASHLGHSQSLSLFECAVISGRVLLSIGGV